MRLKDPTRPTESKLKQTPLFVVSCWQVLLLACLKSEEPIICCDVAENGTKRGSSHLFRANL